MTKEIKQQKLQELIEILCQRNIFKNDKSIVDWLNTINDIFTEGFKFVGSEIFNKLQFFLAKDWEVHNVIIQNISEFETEILRNNQMSKEAKEGFSQYADYIRLEIARYNFIKTQLLSDRKNSSGSSENNGENSKTLKNSISQLTQDLSIIRPIALRAQKDLEGIDTKLENNKVSNITTLTIFSAVVLAFSGGITFISGVFDGLSEVTAHRLVFIVCLSGFILFNTIFSLLYIVGKISHKPIGTKCRYITSKSDFDRPFRSCGDGFCSRACTHVTVPCRIIHKYSYLFVVNMLLLWIMYGDFVLWSFDSSSVTFILGLHIAFPLFIILLSFAFARIEEEIQLKRIIIDEKVKVVESYLHYIGKEHGNHYSRLIIDLFPLIPESTRDLRAKRLKQVLTFRLSSNRKNLYAFNKQIDDYIRFEQLSSTSLANTVTFQQHKNNSRKWSVLFNKLVGDDKH